MDSLLGAEQRIDGVKATLLREIGDERGAVLHMLRDDDPDFVRFGECYFSEVVPGAVKAWKRHRLQTQNLAVPVGRVRLVIYDDRASSPTRGQLQAIDLGRPDSYYRLRIPSGVWYGFVCTSQVPALIANCSDVAHDPTDNEHRPMDDPGIPFSWSSPGPGDVAR